MKNKFKYIFVIFFLFMLFFTSETFAHSGRTDSNGGHRDNKNVSGLGSYHYHCGGNEAHLHPNGICPYSGSSNTSNTYNNINRSNTSINEVKNKNINAIFIDKDDDRTNAELIAKETNAQIYVLDSGLSGELDKNAYIDTMNKNYDVLREAIK